jgi:hypothetical protein
MNIVSRRHNSLSRLFTKPSAAPVISLPTFSSPLAAGLRIGNEDAKGPKQPQPVPLLTDVAEVRAELQFLRQKELHVLKKSQRNRRARLIMSHVDVEQERSGRNVMEKLLPITLIMPAAALVRRAFRKRHLFDHQTICSDSIM